YQFLLDALTGDKKSQSEKTPDIENKKSGGTNLDFQINKIHLGDVAVVFDDQYGGQGHQVKLASLDINVKDLDINDKVFVLKSINTVKPYYVLKTYEKSEKEDKESAPFNVDLGLLLGVNKLQIKDGHFGMHDHTKERTHSKNGFEFSWFDVKDID